MEKTALKGRKNIRLKPNPQSVNLLLSLVSFCAVVMATPVKAAEHIYLTYGPAKLSLRVESLELFAKENKINQDLTFYFRRTTEQEEAKFREALTKRVDIDPTVLSRFFNTEIGEDILNRFGNFITLERSRNGKYAIRAALIQAALDPQEGLTLLNVIRKFPTNIQLQGEKILEFAEVVDTVIKATIAFSNDMAELSASEAQKDSPIDFSQLPDLRESGGLDVQKTVINLNDTSRNRRFYLVIYQPKQWRSSKTPVIVFSHGLASRPEDFETLAKHLASYGYVVAMPQHPGSDYLQAKALLEGYSREVFDLNEFVNRPKDISYVLDELERRNQSEFEGRLDLENVGVAGHSFGGYTALAVGGAEIDFEYLQNDCDNQLGALNTSLLLQCRALKLPRQAYHFRDPRVKAVFASNPVNSSIFGPKGLGKIQIPVGFGSGNFDPATPAVYEQVRSFLWINSSQKYLGLAEGQAHLDFSQLDAGITQVINSVPNLTLPSPELLHRYRNAMAIAFFGIYLLNDPQYRPYLSASYAAYLSQPEQFKLHLISANSQPNLEEAIKRFKAKEGDLIPN
ncbi:protein of unknown function DUF1400 [Gloeothece citriformis PCC 7424]|uniref:DUF1400 domain-containing protein n=1 Tax=Gloeothece citriformis (strain PCC 7424) TaxID=65393 RepID=B7KLM7_GLOC7|nr:alpha/beta hydrolase [Gloeothece citriformis]ACK72599.1 protein of unknown function DUF1400 [Gloeothece citriformis PCC 7424]